jgi:hypothetical protein
MGYPHIGRHPAEIMNANDIDVPADHILPQFLIGAVHYCIFYKNNPTVTIDKFKKSTIINNLNIFYALSYFLFCETKGIVN